MFLTRATLRNVRSIPELTWTPGADAGPGWHVILGDNGAGKSTFLRSIALALIGPRDALGLRQSWAEWLRAGTERGEIRVGLQRTETDDGFSGSGTTPRASALQTGVTFERQGGVQLAASADIGSPDRHVWGNGSGWFCASYGPFRRFTGGDKDFEKLFYSQPKLARHLSVFGESVALTEALAWLKELKFKALENDPIGDLLEPFRAFINQPEFLPHGVKLVEISSKGVEFEDADGIPLPVEALSDGYRSILSMTFELIRQMALTFGPTGLFSDDAERVLRSGVVLIDEIDAHLHPTWQRTIGFWFRRHFPNVQFIVSTHSPLVCHAAEHGTVFRLPRPGASASEDQGEMVTGLALQRLLYGNVLDAYGTGVFGPGVTRSDQANELLDELAGLNARALSSSLRPDEEERREALKRMLPTDAAKE